jgi:hypothetical protein
MTHYFSNTLYILFKPHQKGKGRISFLFGKNCWLSLFGFIDSFEIGVIIFEYNARGIKGTSDEGVEPDLLLQGL